MSDLVLSPAQSKLVLTSKGQVRVLDDRGREIGQLAPMRPDDEALLSISPDEVDELSHRMSQELDPQALPTTQQVVARLRQRAGQ